MIVEIPKPINACFRCKEIKPDVKESIDPTDGDLKFICHNCSMILLQDATGDDDQ